MGNIAVHSSPNGPVNVPADAKNVPAAPMARAWEPARMMRELFGWDPFREIAPFSPFPSGYVPSFEVKETRDAYVFVADVPGVKESDLDVTMTGNRLTVSGTREAEQQEQTDAYYTYERSYGDFTRSFTLPDDADAGCTYADLKDGVLTVSIKKRPEAQPKKIAIGTAKKS